MDNLDFLETEEVIEQVEPQVEAPPEPEPVAQEVKQEPIMVPLAALHDVRDKLKTAEAKLAEKLEPEPIPDVFENPEGFANHQAQIAHQAALNAKLDLSEDITREKHGDQLVDSAYEWAKQKAQEDPGFGNKILSQRNPYGFVVAEYQRDQMVSQVKPDEWTQFQAWKAAQTQATAAPAAPQVEVPRSIAEAPSAAGAQHVALGDAAIFDDFFKR